jgi:hypothetical protein
MIAGLVITMAAAGGIDNASDAQLFGCVMVAVLGMLTMYSGLVASKNI